MTKIKLKEGDLAIVIRADGEVEMILPPDLAEMENVPDDILAVSFVGLTLGVPEGILHFADEMREMMAADEMLQ